MTKQGGFVSLEFAQVHRRFFWFPACAEELLMALEVQLESTTKLVKKLYIRGQYPLASIK